MIDNDKQDLVAVRDEKTGKFLPGNPGNGGRPAGSKNRITLMKVALEEAFRDNTYEDVLEVLHMVVSQALAGDKSSQKMVWESSLSKGLQSNDKDAKEDKGFTVHHMHHDVEDTKSDKEAKDE